MSKVLKTYVIALTFQMIKIHFTYNNCRTRNNMTYVIDYRLVRMSRRATGRIRVSGIGNLLFENRK